MALFSSVMLLISFQAASLAGRAVSPSALPLRFFDCLQSAAARSRYTVPSPVIPQRPWRRQHRPVDFRPLPRSLPLCIASSTGRWHRTALRLRHPTAVEEISELRLEGREYISVHISDVS